MKRFIACFALAASAALLAACATGPSGARLTYETSPAGATLYEGGQSIGVAPQMRAYPADPSGGQIRTPEVTAIWPSGAKATFFTFLKVGDDNVTTITRPLGAPNAAVDEENAKKYLGEEQRRQAQLQRDVSRNSARCQAQQQGGVVAGIDDCK